MRKGFAKWGIGIPDKDENGEIKKRHKPEIYFDREEDKFFLEFPQKGRLDDFSIEMLQSEKVSKMVERWIGEPLKDFAFTEDGTRCYLIV